MEQVPSGHPDELTYVTNLWAALRSRYRLRGELDDLEGSVLYQRRVVASIPDSHPTKPILYHGLGSSLKARFKHLDDLNDLEESIEDFRWASEWTTIPNCHTISANCLHLFGPGLVVWEVSTTSKMQSFISAAWLS